MLSLSSEIGGYIVLKEIAESKRTPIYLVSKNGTKYVLKITNDKKIKYEYAIMAQMSHPNILKANEIIIKNNLFGIIMPFARGKTLLDYFSFVAKQCKIVSEKKIRSIMKQLIEGLCYMHGIGLVHRDIKLENIYFLDEEYDHVVLADFEFTSSINNKMNFLGTDPYKAPEFILENNSYTNKIDCWSLGIVLYILLFNCYPFNKSNLSDSSNVYWDVTKILNGDYQLGQIKRSKYAKNLIKKLLCVDPEKRYSANQALNHQWFQQDADQIIARSDYINTVIIEEY